MTQWCDVETVSVFHFLGELLPYAGIILPEFSEDSDSFGYEILLPVWERRKWTSGVSGHVSVIPGSHEVNITRHSKIPGWRVRWRSMLFCHSQTSRFCLGIFILSTSNTANLHWNHSNLTFHSPSPLLVSPVSALLTTLGFSCIPSWFMSFTLILQFTASLCCLPRWFKSSHNFYYWTP